MAQISGPRDARPDGARLAERNGRPDPQRRRSYTSQDLSVKFLRPITRSTGPLRCEGTVIHLGSRTALAQARLIDAQGKLYAHATSSCLIFRP